MANSPITDRQSTFKLDGTIPAWGLFTMLFTIGMMWATYSWSTMRDLNDRLIMREVKGNEYSRKVDELEKQQRDVGSLIGSMRSDITVVKELMLRMEKRFDNK